MNPAEPAPSPADDRPVSDVARRLGPSIVALALVLTVAMLTWLGTAPTAIAGDIEEAPFTVPATLVVPPDDDGCFDLVAGDGEVTTHCLDELATDDRREEWIEVTFLADGTLDVFRQGPDGGTVLRVDPDTGEVLEREEWEPGDERPDEHVPGRDEPERGPAAELEVYTDGDTVRRLDEDGFGPPAEPEDDPVLLDLDGPPGYRLRDAAVSPDGEWVVAVTPDDQVVVAPTDGSADPYVWAATGDEGWIDLRRGIRWDG